MTMLRFFYNKVTNNSSFIRSLQCSKSGNTILIHATFGKAEILQHFAKKHAEYLIEQSGPTLVYAFEIPMDTTNMDEVLAHMGSHAGLLECAKSNALINELQQQLDALLKADGNERRVIFF